MVQGVWHDHRDKATHLGWRPQTCVPLLANGTYPLRWLARAQSRKRVSHLGSSTGSIETRIYGRDDQSETESTRRMSPSRLEGSAELGVSGRCQQSLPPRAVPDTCGINTARVPAVWLVLRLAIDQPQATGTLSSATLASQFADTTLAQVIRWLWPGAEMDLPDVQALDDRARAIEDLENRGQRAIASQYLAQIIVGQIKATVAAKVRCAWGRLQGGCSVSSPSRRAPLGALSPDPDADDYPARCTAAARIPMGGPFRPDWMGHLRRNTQDAQG